jgi:hypothetical protein
MAEKALTARQVAERYNVAGSTVRGWLLRKLLPGAYLKETELGDSYWLVPESALKDFVPPKPGPAPKAKADETANRAAKKKAISRWENEGGATPKGKKKGGKK